jgi:hypothetical protein
MVILPGDIADQLQAANEDVDASGVRRRAPQPLGLEVGHVEAPVAEEQVIGVHAAPLVAAMAQDLAGGDRSMATGPRQAVGNRYGTWKPLIGWGDCRPKAWRVALPVWCALEAQIQGHCRECGITGLAEEEDTMIHHLSIAARDPKHAAEVLAEIMGGKAVPFPPNPGSFFALQLDDHGSGVEVYPAGTELQPAGEEGGSFVRKPREGRGFGATHFALSVAADEGKVKQIAERAGWHCVTCNRGPFHVIEVWVENDTMVEVLPPDFAAEYLAWTRPDTVATRMTSAPRSGARHTRARSA